MPSPFPGMDPYLEDPAFWSDFHPRFINYLCEAIADRLPDHDEARIGDRVSLSDVDEDHVKRIGPDVSIHRPGTPAPGQPAAARGVAVLEPVTVPLLILDEARHAYVEILSRPERTLVAVLELLSPSNKVGSRRWAYLEKRNALVFQDVHLVELDLLLGGHRLPMNGPLPPGQAYAFVARGDRRPDCEIYAWTIRQPLPTLPVPLRAPDPDLLIDLAAVFHTAFDRGRYVRSLAYGKPLAVPLPAEDRDWALECSRTGGA